MVVAPESGLRHLASKIPWVNRLPGYSRGSSRFTPAQPVRRFIPVIRHFISIPAGIGRMPLPGFLLTTLLGATLWNTFLLLCGMKLREHWPTVQKYSHKIDIVIVALLVLAAVWWVKVRLPQFRKPSPPSGGAPHSDAATQ